MEEFVEEDDDKGGDDDLDDQEETYTGTEVPGLTIQSSKDGDGRLAERDDEVED